ncbi:MAG: phage holin family protein [Bacteroidales bacterium]|nr:phage holin family protein [Bacteroidales bacterium]
MITQARKFSNDFSSLSDNVKGYIRLKLELYKLMAVEGVAQLLSGIMMTIVVMLLAFFFLFFLALAFVYWYGEVVGPMYVGSLIVVAFYLVAAALVFIFRDRLFINPLITKLTDVTHEEGSDEEK